MENCKEWVQTGYPAVFLFRKSCQYMEHEDVHQCSVNGFKRALERRWKAEMDFSWTNCPPSPSGHIYFSELVWRHQVNYQVNNWTQWSV